jgi:hypothetical protein
MYAGCMWIKPCNSGQIIPYHFLEKVDWPKLHWLPRFSQKTKVKSVPFFSRVWMGTIPFLWAWLGSWPCGTTTLESKFPASRPCEVFFEGTANTIKPLTTQIGLFFTLTGIVFMCFGIWGFQAKMLCLANSRIPNIFYNAESIRITKIYSFYLFLSLGCVIYPLLN